MSIKTLGKTLGDLNIPILRITNPGKNIEVNQSADKPVILIIGRQHPGETHSSFVIHGLINFLISSNAFASKLRDQFEWWVVPMINPDGVVIGNYRTNLQGKDMKLN